MDTTAVRGLKSKSALFAKLLPNMTPIRCEQLLAIAASDDRPERPAAGECCGSSCDPCVNDLYRQELRIWKDCRETAENSVP